MGQMMAMQLQLNFTLTILSSMLSGSVILPENRNPAETEEAINYRQAFLSIGMGLDHVTQDPQDILFKRIKVGLYDTSRIPHNIPHTGLCKAGSNEFTYHYLWLGEVMNSTPSAHEMSQ